MSASIRWRGSEEELQQKLADLPGVIAGRIRDGSGAVEKLKMAVGLTLLALVRADFEIKAAGGTGEVGGQWQPLSPVTLALRRINSGAATTKRIKSKIPGLANFQKEKLARQAKQLANIIYMRPELKKERRHALSILRRKQRRGDITARQFKAAEKRLTGKLTMKKAKQEILAGATAQILRDTGRLLNSLSPVMRDSDTIIDVKQPGAVEVGSNVRTSDGKPLLALHNSDKPRQQKKDGTGPRLPRRQVLPEPDDFPQRWLEEISRTISKTIASREFMLAYLGNNAA